MNKNYLLLVVLLSAAAVLYTLQPETAIDSTSQYIAYLHKFNKAIPNGAELVYRSKIFASYVENMNKHNLDEKQTYKMGINQFSDLTSEEFVSTYLGEQSNSDDSKSISI